MAAAFKVDTDPNHKVHTLNSKPSKENQTWVEQTPYNECIQLP